MKTAECQPTDEIFTHIEEETGVVRHINASALGRDRLRWIKEGKAEALVVAIEPGWPEYIRERRGVEQWKIDRLCEPYLSAPCLGFWMPDGSCLTVDGHHRVVKLYEAGETTYRLIIFDHDLLHLYCIDDMPVELDTIIVQDTISQIPLGDTPKH